MMPLLAFGKSELGMVIEIISLTAVFYGVLRFLRSTRGFGILRGLAVFFVFTFLTFYVLSFYPGVPVLGHLLKQIVPYVVLILFILFQPELRQGISRFGRAGMFRFLRSDTVVEQTLPMIVMAAQRMAKERIGALIAFEREVSLAPYRENAVNVDAPVSSILLETIFFPGSPLHDGAVVIRNDEIISAACLLPLADAGKELGRLGTRHRAALGLSEETDAITLVVSEETGQVSICSAGILHRPIPHDQLEDKLNELLLTEAPIKKEAPLDEKEEELPA
ncbi:MAG TPA: diadenylate cyclase CdaA [Planctomycetota bacterium]|jgi:diadenylate cyclase|nr:diadenylate cyclase CdaA [Planctomycetota bacterium]MDP7560140.1 diadenylate cyclase CdaA [Planctomycetota bacterium]HJM40188.1 diadenylate cyclase CdaA [Planctomycetota bacterium]|tara:strand:+ start:32847 stop:33680 length:834 start_codon:yes stop_codon:yes gene_type:complete